MIIIYSDAGFISGVHVVMVLITLTCNFEQDCCVDDLNDDKDTV